jgi:hypothetical protein
MSSGSHLDGSKRLVFARLVRRLLCPCWLCALADQVGSGELCLKGLVVGPDEEKGYIEVLTELPRLVL